MMGGWWYERITVTVLLRLCCFVFKSLSESSKSTMSIILALLRNLETQKFKYKIVPENLHLTVSPSQPIVQLNPYCYIKNKRIVLKIFVDVFIARESLLWSVVSDEYQSPAINCYDYLTTSNDGQLQNITANHLLQLSAKEGCSLSTRCLS